MTVARSIVPFVIAALAEIGDAWLVWQGWREHRGLLWIGAVVLALGAYRFADTFQPDKWDYLGAGICLLGVAAIMYAPR